MKSVLCTAIGAIALKCAYQGESRVEEGGKALSSKRRCPACSAAYMTTGK